MIGASVAIWRLRLARIIDWEALALGKYGKRLGELLGLPPEGQGVAFGTFRPSDSAYLVEELANERIRDLDFIANDSDLSAATRSAVSARRFHTYEDYLQDLKNRRPTRKDFIDYGSSLRRGDADLQGYLAHIRSRDEPFYGFLQSPHAARVDRDAFDTSVYITGETKSGKSYLQETLAFLLAREPNAGVWVIDPHGSLARNCASWKENLGRNAFYFDVNIGSHGELPRFNPFDQLPDSTPATLDIVTQEQVNAFSVIAGSSAMTDNMRNLLASAIHLMLALPTGTMQELFRLMNDERNEDLISAGTQLKNPFHREFFLHEFPQKKFKVTKEAIATRIAALLSSSALYGITAGKSTFHIPTAFNQAGVYIFNFGKGVIGETASTMFGRLVLAQLQAAAFKRERDGLTEKRVPTKNYVLIDECHNFVNHTTGTIVAEARKYGLSLILGQQFPGQDIEAGLMKNILTNTPLKFTGVGTAGTYETIAQSQQADRESFFGLRPRLFHVSKRGSLPFIAAASSFLAGHEARMSPDEWRAFTTGQLARWYGGDAQDGTGEAKGVRLVSDTGEQRETHQSALKSLTGANQPERASESHSATPAGVFAAISGKLTGQKPSPPVPANLSETPNSSPQDDGFTEEVEIEKGVFYSRRRPRFPRP